MKRLSGRQLLFVCLALVSAGLAVHRLAWLSANTGGRWGWDYAIYAQASKAFAGENPYLPYHVGTGFLNHPILILIAAPFQALGPAGQWVWIALLALLWIGIWRFANRPGLPSGAALFPLLFWTPAVEAVLMGQASLPAAACLLAALELSRREKPLSAGIALAGAVLLKSSLAVFLIYFAVRRNLRLTAAALGMAAALTLLCEVVLYRGVTLDFLASLQTTAGLVHVSAQNASLAPLLGRAGPVAGALLLGALAWRAARTGAEAPAAGFAAWSLLFSPLTWHHHFLWLTGAVASGMRTSTALGVIVFMLAQADLLGQLAGMPVHPAAIAALAVAFMGVFHRPDPWDH